VLGVATSGYNKPHKPLSLDCAAEYFMLVQAEAQAELVPAPVSDQVQEAGDLAEARD
jgi:hypothetical protein